MYVFAIFKVQTLSSNLNKDLVFFFLTTKQNSPNEKETNHACGSLDVHITILSKSGKHEYIAKK